KGNIRGDTSGKEMPQSAQARRSENSMGSAPAVGRLCSPLFCLTGGSVPLPPDPPIRVASFRAVLLVRPSSLFPLLLSLLLPSLLTLLSFPLSASLAVTGSTWTTPSASLSAVSRESARREPRLSRTIRR